MGDSKVHGPAFGRALRRALDFVFARIDTQAS